MLFLLQAQDDCNALTVEYAIWKDLILSSHIHRYEELHVSDFYEGNEQKKATQFPAEYVQAIPLGTIEFTTAFLNIFKNIAKIYPVEIPKCLRTNDFLKRDYDFVYGRDIPTSGTYFVKNASTLKEMSCSGDISRIIADGQFNIKKNDVYQISDIMDVLAEYRVYVINEKIYGIAYYDGDPCIFPDVKLLQKMVCEYSKDKDKMLSYTMDIMVTTVGTALIEMHPLFSCGLYQSILGTGFLHGYVDAMSYIMTKNKPILPDYFVKGVDKNDIY